VQNDARVQNEPESADFSEGDIRVEFGPRVQNDTAARIDPESADFSEGDI
ncbi:unnamed protein product, partial [Penicillium egyptiacum]